MLRNHRGSTVTLFRNFLSLSASIELERCVEVPTSTTTGQPGCWEQCLLETKGKRCINGCRSAAVGAFMGQD